MRSPRKWNWRRGEVRVAEAPETWAALSPGACLGLVLATRTEPDPARARAFRDHESVLTALAHGILTMDDSLRIRPMPRAPWRATTVGRFLVSECLPPEVRDAFADGPWNASRVNEALSRIVVDAHVEVAARAAEALERLGRFVADRSGASIAMRDFTGPSVKGEIMNEATAETAAIHGDYNEGLITDGERYNKAIDTWSYTTERLRIASKVAAPERDPLAALVASRVDDARPESLRIMLGVCVKANGEIFERPILHSLGEGLDPHEYMMRCMPMRHGMLDQGERDEVAAALRHDLDTVLGETAIGMRDCQTEHGVRVQSMAHLAEGVRVPFSARIVGRVLLTDVLSREGDVLVRAGSPLSRRDAERIDEAEVPHVMLRDVMTCEARYSVCAVCFGLDPDDATWPAEDDEVGARAASRIAECARSFGFRTFHIC